MFTIASNVLKDKVGDFAAAYRKALVDVPVVVSANIDTQKITLNFTSTEISLSLDFDADVKASANFVVAMQELFTKVSALPKDSLIAFEKSTTGNYKIKWGKSNLLHLSVKKDPLLQTPSTIEFAKSVVFSTSQWQYFTLNFVPFCSIRGSETFKRFPATVGVNFRKLDNHVCVTATNVSRIIYNRFDFEWFDEALTISRNTFNVVNSLLGKENLTISLSDNRTNIVISTENATITARLLTDEYPNVEPFFNPLKNDIVWRLDRLELLEVAKRIRHIDSENPKITLLERTEKTFAQLEGVLIEQLGGVIETELKSNICLDAGSLEGALTVLRGDEVLLALAEGELSPVVLYNAPIDEGTEENVEDYLKVVLGQVKK
jgi:DNA polymerase III sliding clamp (beta) subunit (PCNA family)